jgi:tripartite-type tricarboxylate transporter receptor subunit TctC
MLARMKSGKWALVAAFVLCSGGAVDAQQEFYRNRTVDLIVSTGAGGALDTNARLLAKYWAKHIPGNPTIVVQNMPGAGHVRAANYLANEAPRDGSVIGSIEPAFLLAEVLKTSNAIKFNAADFNWLGSSASNNSTIYVWSTAPVQTMQDVEKTPVLMGATGAGSYTVIYPTILNAVVGTKFKIVAGYPDTRQINLAMQSGEVQGRAGNNLNSIKAENPQWLPEKKIRILAQVGLERDPEFKNIPLMLEFGKTPEDRTELRLFSADIAVGRPYLAPPGVPKDRVNTLRRSFDETMKDPEFLKATAAAGVNVAPSTGEKLQNIVAQIVATPPDIVARARAAMELANNVAMPNGGVKAATKP